MIGAAKGLFFLVAFLAIAVAIVMAVGRISHGKGFMDKPATLGDVLIMLGSVLVSLAICMTLIHPWLKTL